MALKWRLALALCALQPRGAHGFLGSIVGMLNGGVTTGLAVFVVLLIVIVLVRYSDRVLMALTGDDRIHGDSLNCCWWTFCRMCGTCSGDWTRCCTRCCTCLPTWCFPTWLRGANLVRLFGQFIGLVSVPVEIKSLVAGDLPFDTRGDFYLSIECSTNPPMVTSLIEESRAKVVHFPEVMTLKLRKSLVEPRVRFVVKELNVFGSNELCELYLSAMQILDWSNDLPDERMKRFQMTVLDNSMERVTPPWICMEFSEPTESRHLSEFNSMETVRTLVPNKDNETILEARDFSVKEFKDDYTLIDGTGNPVDEPDEHDLWKIETLRRSLKHCIRFINMIIFILVSIFAAIRFYIWSCYRQFRWITQVYENVNSANNSLFAERFPHIVEHSFPVSQNHLHDVKDWCGHQVEGTGIDSGVPCRPNFNQTLHICTVCVHNRTNATNIAETIDQPRPKAFGALIHQFAGVEGYGLKCFEGICNFRNEVAQYDTIAIIVGICAIAFTVLLQMAGNWTIRWYKRRQQAKKKNEKKAFFDSQKSGATATGTRV